MTVSADVRICDGSALHGPEPNAQATQKLSGRSAGIGHASGQSTVQFCLRVLRSAAQCRSVWDDTERNAGCLFLSLSWRYTVCAGAGRRAVVAARCAGDPQKPLSDRRSSHADYERQDRSGQSDWSDHVDHPEKLDRLDRSNRSGSGRDR